MYERLGPGSLNIFEAILCLCIPPILKCYDNGSIFSLKQTVFERRTEYSEALWRKIDLSFRKAMALANWELQAGCGDLKRIGHRSVQGVLSRPLGTLSIDLPVNAVDHLYVGLRHKRMHRPHERTHKEQCLGRISVFLYDRGRTS